MIIWLRSLLFNLLWFCAIPLLLIILLPMLLMSRGVMQYGAKLFTGMTSGLLRFAVGLRWRVAGLEHLPDGPYIIAAKHQSAFDTMVFHLFLDDPIFVLKQELTKLPIYGRMAMHAGMISVDRSAGASALRHLVQETRAAAANGSQIIIFPQGTRTAPGQYVPYHPGVAAMYKNSGLPVVPCALNTGMFWGRRTFLKHPGIMTIKFLEPIPPGLSRREFMERLEAVIERETALLSDTASDDDKPVQHLAAVGEKET
ncbi:MAG: lysophospholipid acyltransferase family protein [Rhodospirillales bacterium]